MNSKQCVNKHDEWAEEYDSENEVIYFKFLIEIVDKIVFDYLPKKGKILDAAGGTGRLTIPFAKKGYQVTCTDLSEKMLNQCAKKIKDKRYANNVTILKSDVTNMKELRDNEFNFTVCVGNIISYCDYNKALSEIRRVTKKGSYVVIDMHSYYQELRNCIMKKDVKAADRLIKTHNYFNGHFNEHCFDIDEIQKVFKANKIKVVKIFGKSILPNATSVEKMNKLLKDKKFYNNLKSKELKIIDRPDFLCQALELCVIGKVL